MSSQNFLFKKMKSVCLFVFFCFVSEHSKNSTPPLFDYLRRLQSCQYGFVEDIL